MEWMGRIGFWQSKRPLQPGVRKGPTSKRNNINRSREPEPHSQTGFNARDITCLSSHILQEPCETRQGKMAFHRLDVEVNSAGMVVFPKRWARTVKQLMEAGAAWATAREIWDRLRNVAVRINRQRLNTSAPTGIWKYTPGSHHCHMCIYVSVSLCVHRVCASACPC